MDADLDSLWDEHKGLQDQSLRDQLILHYSPLRITSRAESRHRASAKRRASGSRQLRNLRVDRRRRKASILRRGYNLRRTPSRIKGAIFDELGSIDWVPRLVRQSETARVVARQTRGFVAAYADRRRVGQRTRHHRRTIPEPPVAAVLRRSRCAGTSCSSAAWRDCGDTFSWVTPLPIPTIAPSAPTKSKKCAGSCPLIDQPHA